MKKLQKHFWTAPSIPAGRRDEWAASTSQTFLTNVPANVTLPGAEKVEEDRGESQVSPSSLVKEHGFDPPLPPFKQC